MTEQLTDTEVVSRFISSQFGELMATQGEDLKDRVLTGINDRCELPHDIITILITRLDTSLAELQEKTIEAGQELALATYSIEEMREADDATIQEKGQAMSASLVAISDSIITGIIQTFEAIFEEVLGVYH